MKAVDPTIKVGVVLYEGYGGFNNTPQSKNWNEIIMPITQHAADFYIIHHYPHPNKNQNDISEADMYAAISVVEETHHMMEDLTEQYTEYDAGHFPIAITEFNARAGVRNLSRSNALFTTLMLCEYAKYDYEAATQWDLVNGYTEDRGDHGLVSRRDPFLQTGSVNPEFYAFYYLNQYFGDKMVASTSSNELIKTYATTFSSGELGLVMVNTSADDQIAAIDIANFELGDSAYWHVINGDQSDFDRTVYINGIGPDTSFTVGNSYTSNYGSNEYTQTATAYESNGVSGPQDYENIAPFSTSTQPEEQPKFSLPKHSVTYVVLEASANQCDLPETDPNYEPCLVTGLASRNNDEFTVFPNPTIDWIRLSSDTQYEIFTLAGQLISKSVGDAIDMSNWSNGTYIVRLNGAYHKVVKR